MEKSTPHYDLAVIKAEVIRLGSKAFTMTAREGGSKNVLKHYSDATNRLLAGVQNAAQIDDHLG
jgi:hypothetical protein